MGLENQERALARQVAEQRAGIGTDRFLAENEDTSYLSDPEPVPPVIRQPIGNEEQETPLVERLTS